jgi:hypothetical protein
MSSSTTEATVEATMAKSSIRDAERADADVVMEEVPPVAGQEAAQAGEPQPQQDPPAGPAATVEGEAIEPPPKAPGEEVPAIEAPALEVPTVEVSALAEESAPVTVELTLDDLPLDKGKQVVRVEGGEAVDQAGASMAAGEARAAGEAGPFTGPEGAPAGSSSSWPEIATLAIARAEAEIPRWGGPSLEFRDATNPDAGPIFTLNDRDEVHRWEYLEGLRRHLERALRVATETLSRGVRDATEVRLACQFFSWFFCCLFPSAPNLFGFFRTMIRSSRNIPAASRSSS